VIRVGRKGDQGGSLDTGITKLNGAALKTPFESIVEINTTAGGTEPCTILLI